MPVTVGRIFIEVPVGTRRIDRTYRDKSREKERAEKRARVLNGEFAFGQGTRRPIATREMPRREVERAELSRI